MELLASSATLIVVATLSIVINRQFLSRVSVNYVSMLLGGLLAAIPVLNGLVTKFDSDIFIGLIVAPLLFLRGRVPE